jgi:hypothetical protein
LWSFVGHVEAVWLLLIAPEVIAALRGAFVSDLRAVLAGSGGLFAHLALLLRFAEHDERSLFPPFAACALLGAGALLVPRCAALGTWLARAGSVLLPLGTVVAATRLTFPMEGQPDVHWWCLGGLVGVAVLLAVVRRWTRVAELGMTLAALLEVAIGSLGVLGRERVVPMLAATLLLLVVSRTTPARLAGLLLGVIAAPMGLLPMHSLVGEGSSWMALTFALACGVATLALLVGSRVRDRVLATVAALVELVVLVKWIEEALGANAMNVRERHAAAVERADRCARGDRRARGRRAHGGAGCGRRVARVARRDCARRHVLRRPVRAARRRRAVEPWRARCRDEPLRARVCRRAARRRLLAQARRGALDGARAVRHRRGEGRHVGHARHGHPDARARDRRARRRVAARRVGLRAPPSASRRSIGDLTNAVSRSSSGQRTARSLPSTSVHAPE